MVVDQIRYIAEREGIAVLGIGPAASMVDEPPGHRPEDLLPGAESLVCYGIPVPREVYHMPQVRPETVWRSQNLLYRRLDTLSVRFAALLEETGARAVPTYGCMPLGVNERGVVVGYVNQIRMGEVTGIGTVGRNGLLLHPRFGSRLMLGGVITTANLPAVRYPEGNESGSQESMPQCPPDCRICADACPVNAILPAEKKVKIMRCLSYTARTPTMSRLRFAFLRIFRPEAAARYMSITAFDEHTFHTCSRCVALCPYGEGT
jgi:epoxyqueuosine reductase